MSTENAPKQEATTIGVKIRVDALTDTMIVDKEKGLNILLVAIPLSTPKLVALGFLWSVLDNMTTFYKAAEAEHKLRNKGGIIKAGVNDALALGKKLLPGV